MRTADLVTASLLLALGSLVVWDSWRIGMGWGHDGPRSGFFPFWMGVVLVVCCLGILAQAAWRRADRPFLRRESVGPVLKVLLPSTALVVVMQGLGLYVASALFLAVYMRWIGRHSWPLVAAVAVAFPIVSFLVFETWFLVPMPKGPVETWLGY